MAEPERLLTIAAAAELTSYPEAVIVGWLHSGLRYCTGAPGRQRIWQKHVRIRATDLWAWIDQLSVTRRAAAAMEKPVKSRRAPARTDDAGPSAGLSAWREQRGKA